MIAVCALVIRVGYAASRHDVVALGDSKVYHNAANALADGEGFTKSAFMRDGLLVWDTDNPEASANPPGAIAFYSIGSFLGLRSFQQHMVWASMLGTATVVIVGLLTRRLAGHAAGLSAATAAAVYPSLWSWDGFVTSESVACFLAVLLVWLITRFGDKPTLWRIIGIGSLGGIAVLTRSELSLYLPLIYLPTVIRHRSWSWRQRSSAIAIAALTAITITVPWMAYNSGRFEHPVLLTTSFGQTLASGNCDATYYGDFSGYWSFGCNMSVAASADMPKEADQTQADRAYARFATRYAKDHIPRLAAVVPMRIGRTFYLYRPLQQLRFDRDAEGREPFVALSAFIGYWILALASVVGIRHLRRLGNPVLGLVMPFFVVAAGVALTFGNVRYRSTAEPFLCVLGGIGLVTVTGTLRSRVFAHKPDAVVEKAV